MDVSTYLVTPIGMDTGVVDKGGSVKSDYRPGFMQHFDKKDDKKKGMRKQGPQGPHDISYYFPDIPDGMDFRDFVRHHQHSTLTMWVGFNPIV